MPQMSPLLWLNLYAVFTITLVIFVALFFYTKLPSPAPESGHKHLTNKLNWKW